MTHLQTDVRQIVRNPVEWILVRRNGRHRQHLRSLVARHREQPTGCRGLLDELGDGMFFLRFQPQRGMCTNRVIVFAHQQTAITQVISDVSHIDMENDKVRFELDEIMFKLQPRQQRTVSGNAAVNYFQSHLGLL